VVLFQAGPQILYAFAEMKKIFATNAGRFASGKVNFTR
jgi:hypothetical protein